MKTAGYAWQRLGPRRWQYAPVKTSERGLTKRDTDGTQPRDEKGRWSGGSGVPALPGTVPLRPGMVRRFHVTGAANLASIRENGLRMQNARGIEGPRAIYGWPDYQSALSYGGVDNPDNVIVEYQVPESLTDANPYATLVDVPTTDIIGIHEAWHDHYRYAKDNPSEATTPEWYREIGAPQYVRAAEELERDRRTPKATSVSPIEGGKKFSYPMPDGHTLEVTATRSLTDPADLVIDFRDSRGFRNYEWKNTLGAHGVRSILRDIAAEFPESTVASGSRVSGARAGPAALPGSKGTQATFDLTRYRKFLGGLQQLLLKFNPNHEPAGSPKGGQFAPKEGEIAGGEEDLRTVDWNDLTSTEEIRAKLRLHEAEEIDLNGLGRVWVYDEGKTRMVLEWDGDTYTNVTEAKEWVDYADVEKVFPDEEQRFNDEFWESPGVLYHATQEGNVEGIQHGGLAASNNTRGLSNRQVDAAVFASTDPETIDAYGDAVFEIDMAAMKRDGWTPFVRQEPIILENELRTALASMLKLDDYSAPEDAGGGMSSETIIIEASVPSKYLRLLTEKRFNPSQPRAPAGSPTGGQWVGDLGALIDGLVELADDAEGRWNNPPEWDDAIRGESWMLPDGRILSVSQFGHEGTVQQAWSLVGDGSHMTEERAIDLGLIRIADSAADIDMESRLAIQYKEGSWTRATRDQFDGWLGKKRGQVELVFDVVTAKGNHATVLAKGSDLEARQVLDQVEARIGRVESRIAEARSRGERLMPWGPDRKMQWRRPVGGGAAHPGADPELNALTEYNGSMMYERDQSKGYRFFIPDIEIRKIYLFREALAKFNPNHKPAGSPDGGQFAPKEGFSAPATVTQGRETTTRSVRRGKSGTFTPPPAVVAKEKEIVTKNKEELILWNKAGKIVLTKKGTEREVDMSDTEMPSDALHATHNHPSGGAGLSTGDVTYSMEAGLDSVSAVSIVPVLRAPGSNEVDWVVQRATISNLQATKRAFITYLRQSARLYPEEASMAEMNETTLRLEVHEKMTNARSGALDQKAYARLIARGMDSDLAGKVQSVRDWEEGAMAKSIRAQFEDLPASSRPRLIMERLPWVVTAEQKKAAWRRLKGVSKREDRMSHGIDDREMWENPYELVTKFNPNHEPAGSPKGGQFATREGGTASDPARAELARSLSSHAENALDESLAHYTTSQKGRPPVMSAEDERIVRGWLKDYIGAFNEEASDPMWPMPTSVSAGLAISVGGSMMTLTGGRAGEERILRSEITLVLPATPTQFKSMQAATLKEVVDAPSGRGWWTAKEPRDLIAHELTHLLHEQTIGVAAYSAIRTRKFRAAEKRVAATLSEYASKKPVEFVAEAAVRMRQGGTLTPEQRKLYEALGGPKVMPR